MKTESLNVLMIHPRQIAILVLSICALLISPTAMAQTPAPPQQPAEQTATKPQPESPPIPPRSIGLEPGKVVKWRMHDAILTALENNVTIELEKTNVRSAQYNLLQAQGVYDPRTESGFGYGASASPNIFQFSGVQGDNAQRRNTYSYNLGISQPIEKTGANYLVSFNNDRIGNNINNLIVNYNPRLAFEITQPLFRNFKIDSNRNQIKIMKKQLDMSDAQFRQTAIQVITDVMQAYWGLYVAIQNEVIARSSLELAEKQLNDNKRQVEVGTLAPISITEAATVVEQRRSAVFQSMYDVAQAENALKMLTVGGPNSDIWNARIETIDKFEVQENPLPLDDAMKLAMENRPEIKILGLRKEMNQNDIVFFRNQTKPQINFVGTYAIEGVGGTPRTQTTSNCSPVDLNGQRTCLDLGVVPGPNGTFVPGITTTPFMSQTAPVQLGDGFQGGYGTSLRNLFSNDFRTWSIGIRIMFPLRNREAVARLGLAREQEKNTELQIRQQLQTIELEVRNAVQAVEAARQRIESTRKQREYAKEQLDGENKKFQAGLSYVWLVLDRQNALAAAQVAENNAVAEYARATATLQRIISTTLSSNNIEIPDPKVPMK
jgi:outer membrane protein